MYNKILTKITEKKQVLDDLGSPSRTLEQNFNTWLRVNLTYTSNAIEGNTLNLQETSLVVEDGMSVPGKSVNEILEAKNHALAWDFIKSQFEFSKQEITEHTILQIHSIILSGIDEYNKGKYRYEPVRISGSAVILPNYLKVPDLMEELVNDIHTTKEHPVKIAVDAHYKLVRIHPFTDGNGRTARLLMNLILGQAGYVPTLIRPENRTTYINSLEKAHLAGDFSDYYTFMYGAVNRSIDDYLSFVKGEEVETQIKDNKVESQPTEEGELLKIGELAKATDESVPTIRFWTNEGLLEVQELTPSKYQLFNSAMIDRVREIRRLQDEERFSISEIKNRLNSSR